MGAACGTADGCPPFPLTFEREAPSLVCFGFLPGGRRHGFGEWRLQTVTLSLLSQFFWISGGCRTFARVGAFFSSLAVALYPLVPQHLHFVVRKLDTTNEKSSEESRKRAAKLSRITEKKPVVTTVFRL